MTPASKLELANDLHELTKKTIGKLDLIWDEIGLDSATRVHREELFAKHVTDLYNDMLAEAEETKNGLVEYIASLLEEVSTLSHDLRLEIPVDGYEKIPLYEVKKILKNKIKEYRDQLEEKKNEIKKLLNQQKNLCYALGYPCKEIQSSPLPTSDELQEFRTYLEELSDKKFQLEELFTEKKSEIVSLMNELGISPSLDFERKVVDGEDSDFQVTEENMSMLEKLHKCLQSQYEETCNKITDLREQVNKLWERLEESPQVRSDFLQAHPGNSIDTLQALKKEVLRCEEKKKANIKVFVDKMRQELVEWWDKCRCTSQQRDEFIHFGSDCYTEDLLSLYEIQVDRYKTHYESNKPIYDLLVKREELWAKMIELEQRANQPDRYKNRGGQLLREEKERKQICLKLPKIEQELLSLVEEYETRTGKEFLITEGRIADIINSAWEDYKQDKQIKLSARKHARELATPSKSRLGATRLLLTPGTTTHTPIVASTSKRKLHTPIFNSSKRSRIQDDKVIRTALPKIQVNGGKLKRGSLERRKRVERKKRKSKDSTVTSIVSDYDYFENIPLAQSTTYNNFPSITVEGIDS